MDPVTRAAVRSRTEAILSEPRFRPSWKDDPAWLGDLEATFDDLTVWVAEHPEGARWLLVASALLLVAISTHMVWTVVAEVRASRSAASSLDASVRMAFDAEQSEWTAAHGAMLRARAAGDDRQVVWIAHRLFLALLAHEGHLELARWKTNETYGRELADSKLAPEIDRWNRVYERVVYAHQSLASDELDELMREIESHRAHGVHAE